mmetsp:Transcript_7745/g.17947  ORF Transcript_7745/g.17947 Transcript_7745/m.17947 type:complete len:1887 (-) Transcript_7745:58-5718(-)|eukprot:CAMPEP_0114551920 /NCGR_PEP_ID=MMETSP0114-20121206/6854_1 /TAXON_ID=31324 /ORGANISM="Goniomonas sp, Strain m" /LENGTH=1886 /DNA_ID=CAMNT_0001736773 /DNA_START=64 /DNA_END=5724 /DNA_ORIENTATION=-
MSEILSRWINDKVQLSGRVNNFEEDFANGYLFGELLAKYGVLKDFDKFVNRSTPEAKINNFTRLQPCIRSLNLKFDSQVANQVMTEVPGVVPRLLQQLKVQLDMGTGAVLTGQVAGGTMAPSALLLQTDRRIGKPSYERVEAALFEKTLRQKTENPRDYHMSLHLKKFGDEHVRQQKEYEAQQKEKREMEQRKLETLRLESIARVADNKAFLTDWLSKGRETHQQAMTLRRDREKADLSLELALHDKSRRVAQLANARAATEVTKGIEQFEESMRRIVKTEDEGPAARPSTLKPTRPSSASQQVEDPTANMTGAEFMRSLAAKVPREGSLRAEADAYMAKVKEKRRQEELGRRERERRRRRVMVEQHRTEVEMEQKRREEMLVVKLLKQSEEERRIAARLAATMEEKELMIQNRLQREAQYKQQREADYQLSLARDVEVYRAAREDYLRHLEVEKARYAERNAMRLAAVHHKHVDMCRGVVDLIVDVTAKVAEYRDLSEGMAMTPKEWRELMHLFVKGLPIFGSSESDLKSEAGTVAETPDVLDPEDAAQAEALDNAGFEDYIKAAGEWADGSDPCAEHGGVNIHLGGALKDIATVLKVPDEPPPRPDLPQLQYTVSIIGAPMSGKTKQAQKLAAQLNLRLLEPAALVTAAVEKYKAESAAPPPAEGEAPPLSAVAELGKRASATAENGEPVEDEVVVKLIVESIKELKPPSQEPPTPAPAEKKGGKAPAKGKAEAKPPPNEVNGWVLDGFPCNKAQAQLLEQGLSGYVDPPEKRPEDEEPVSLLAPRPPDLPPDHLEIIDSGCLVTVALTVDADVPTKRAYGRALDPQTGQVYHMEFDPPPSKTSADKALKARLKFFDKEGPEAAQLTERVTVHLAEEPEHRAWLEKFGQPTDVDGNEPPDVVAASIKEIVESRAAALAAKDRATSAGGLSIRSGSPPKTPGLEDPPRPPSSKTPDSSKAAPPAAGDEPTPAAPATTPGSEGGEAPEGGEKAEEEEEGEPAPPPPPCEEIHPEVATLLQAQWEHAESVFHSTCRKSLRVVREEHARILLHLATMRRNFIEFLTATDNKQEVLDDFVMQFNALDMELRSHPETKAEIHQRIDEMRNHLWELSDQSREAAEMERTAVMNSGWVDDHARILTVDFLQLAQADVERYQATRRVLRDYYYAKAGAPLPTESPEDLDIVPAAIAELQGKPPEEDGKKDKKAPAKKDDKKGGKAAAPVVAEVVPEEDTPGLKDSDKKLVMCVRTAVAGAKERLGLKAPLEEDLPHGLKEALEVENKALDHRLSKLGDRFRDAVVQFRERETATLQRMDDLVADRFRSEMDAVAGVVLALKTATEQDERITYRLMLEGPTFSEDQDGLLTPPPEPPVPVAREDLGRFKLDSAQLLRLVRELKACAPLGVMPASELTALLRRAASMSGGELLPDAWVTVSDAQMDNLMKALDFWGCGIVHWRRFVAGLAQFPPPTLGQLLSTRAAFDEAAVTQPTPLPKGYVPMDVGKSVRLWVDDLPFECHTLEDGTPIYTTLMPDKVRDVWLELFEAPLREPPVVDYDLMLLLLAADDVEEAAPVDLQDGAHSDRSVPNAPSSNPDAPEPSEKEGTVESLKEGSADPAGSVQEPSQAGSVEGDASAPAQQEAYAESAVEKVSGMAKAAAVLAVDGKLSFRDFCRLARGGAPPLPTLHRTHLTSTAVLREAFVAAGGIVPPTPDSSTPLPADDQDAIEPEVEEPAEPAEPAPAEAEGEAAAPAQTEEEAAAAAEAAAEAERLAAEERRKGRALVRALERAAEWAGQDGKEREEAVGEDEASGYVSLEALLECEAAAKILGSCMHFRALDIYTTLFTEPPPPAIVEPNPDDELKSSIETDPEKPPEKPAEKEKPATPATKGKKK